MLSFIDPVWHGTGHFPGNALERVQRVHKPADLWDIVIYEVRQGCVNVKGARSTGRTPFVNQKMSTNVVRDLRKNILQLKSQFCGGKVSF